MLKTYTLKNGLRVATYSMPDVKSLHLGISSKGGSIVEGLTQNGIAHYMEHMMVQGIPSFPTAESLSNYIESLAGRYNASTSSLLVHFTMTVPFSHIEDAVKIASEVFFRPTFPVESMEKERNAVINELKQHYDSRWYKFSKFFRETRYTSDSVLQRETIGKEEMIKAATVDDLITYWKNYFFPQNMSLFIGGKFSQKELDELLTRYMESEENTRIFSGFPTLSRADLRERLIGIRNDDTLQVNYVSFSFPSLDHTAPTLLKVKESIALDILGRYRSSRLFTLLRYQKGYVYGVSANEVRWPGVGYSSIDSEVASEHLDEVITLIARALKDFIENGPTKEELHFAKNYLTNQWLMAFDNPSSIGDWVEGQLIWKETIELPEDYIRMIQDITVDDLIAVMSEHWDMKKLQLTIQGPIQDTDAVREKYFDMIKIL